MKLKTQAWPITKGPLFFLILILLISSTFTVQAAAVERAAELDIPKSQNSQLAVAPGDTVNLAWFYKPPQDGNLSAIAQNFDTIILTKKDEDIRDQLRAQGVQSSILQYVRFEAIMDPGSCSATPWQNQVAYLPGDFCTISQQHPDWFLLDSNGKRIYDGDGFVQMDPANPGWRAFWVERVKKMQADFGWYGVFLDNVEASLGKHTRDGRQLKKYSDASSYTAAVKGFLQYMYDQYFGPEKRPLEGNIIFIEDPNVWYAYLWHMDGAMEEGWAVDWSQGYLSPAQWDEHLHRIEQTQAMGKWSVLVSQGDRTDTNRQQFAYASYLLVSSARVSFRYANYRNYSETWLYPNYELQLGSPLGARYQQGNVWKRDFTGGTVTVDPVSHTADIEVTGGSPNPSGTQPPSPNPNPPISLPPSAAAKYKNYLPGVTK